MNSNNKTLQGLKKVNDRLLGIETFLLALITILLVAAIFIEVVCRYFLFISAAWAEEFTRYLFIWLTYIGSAYAICDNSHTMRIPMGWVYLPVFVGIVLAALHEVYMLAACLLGGDKKSAAEADN